MSARWLARAAFVLMFASAAVLIAFPERHVRGALAIVAIGAVAACLIVAGGYWYLAHRGVLRQLACWSWSRSRCWWCSPSVT